MSKKRLTASGENVLEAIQTNRLRVNLETGQAEHRGRDRRSPWRKCAHEIVSDKKRNQRYVRISFSVAKQSYRCLLHRVVWWAAGHSIPDNKTINHKYGNPENNRLTNLELMTGIEQAQHAIALGLFTPRAPKKNHENFCHKLTPDKVQEIRKALAADIPQKTIAEQYGVNQSEISRLKTGQRYAWLPPQ